MRGTTLVAREVALRAGGTARGRVLVERCSFAVEPGQRWVALGPNGAGKSSLLAALAGVFPVAGGEIRIDGRCLVEWPGEALAARRAWCPQFWSDPFPADVRATLGLARGRERWWPRPHEPDPVLEAWIDRLDLRAFADVDVRTLSGGERQRVALGTALLQGAPLLLLDEPASHLDLRHRALLLDVLRAHTADAGSVVACVHDLDLAWALATHALLFDGRGNAIAGIRDEVLVADRLDAAFGVAIDVREAGAERRFGVAWNGAAGLAPAHDDCVHRDTSHERAPQEPR